MPRRSLRTRQETPEEVKARLAIFKERLRHSPESKLDWPSEALKAAVRFVDEVTARRLVDAEMRRELDEAKFFESLTPLAYSWKGEADG